MSLFMPTGPTRTGRWALVPALALMASALGTPRAYAQSDASTDRRVLSGSRVAFYNIAGDVRIERGRGRDVEFEVTRRGRDASRLRIETGTVRGLPTLRVIYPEDDIVYRGGAGRDDRSRQSDNTINADGTWGNNDGGSGREAGRRRVHVRSSGSGLEAWADIRVLVPDGVQLDARLFVGAVAATDVTGALDIDVGPARVTTDRTRGDLHIDAGSGGVEVRDASGSRLFIDNGSGGVRLSGIRADTCHIDTGSGGVSGSSIGCRRLDLDVGSGSVRLAEAALEQATLEAGSGGIELGLRTSPADLRVEAGSGGVTLQLPADYDGSVDIASGSGGISTDFPIRTTSVGRRSLRGTIGNGRGHLRVETGSGSVRLRRG